MSDIFGDEPERRSGERSAGSLLSGLDALFDRLIAEAPEGEPTMPVVAQPKPGLVKLIHGWDERYVAEEPELTGDDWHKHFISAKTIVAAGGILALIGNRGTGKTRMAAEISRHGFFPTDRGEWNGNREVVGKSALYRRADDLVNELWDRSKNEHDTSQRFQTCGLLVIDELQEGKEHPSADKALTSIIDKRYGAKRPTILIANLTVEELTKQLSPSVRDRMRENGKALVFGWGSYRTRKTA